jgi:hypothetical protein
MWFNGAVVEGVVCMQQVVSSNPIIDNLSKIAEKNVCMPPLIKFIFSYFSFWIFSDLHFAECNLGHSAKPLNPVVISNPLLYLYISNY